MTVQKLLKRSSRNSVLRLHIKGQHTLKNVLGELKDKTENFEKTVMTAMTTKTSLLSEHATVHTARDSLEAYENLEIMQGDN